LLVRCKQVGVARAIAEVEGRGGSGRQSLETGPVVTPGDRTTPTAHHSAVRGAAGSLPPSPRSPSSPG
jgi:hypothetical protein